MSTAITPHTKWYRAIGVAVGASVAVVVIVLAFLWPTITSEIKDFPIGVTGEPAQVETFTTALDENAEGRFAVTEVADRDEAVALIEQREIYGAIILGAAPEVLTASAGGGVQTQVMSQLAGQLQAQVSAAASAGIKGAVEQATAAVQAGQMPAEAGQQIIQQAIATEIPTVTTTDVVPLADTDARGVGFAAAAFPMVLGGMIGGILISLVVTGVWRRFASIVAYALVAGASLTAVLQPWFGILQGDFLVNWMAMSLTLFATGAFIVGANAVFGRVGIAIGAVATMFIGNPISSVAQPVQFLPGAWGAIGQFFVPGASMTLLRELSYFPDAPQLQSWLVLVGWAVVGVVMMFVGHFRDQEVVHIEGSLEAPAPVRGSIVTPTPVAADV